MDRQVIEIFHACTVFVSQLLVPGLSSCGVGYIYKWCAEHGSSRYFDGRALVVGVGNVLSGKKGPLTEQGCGFPEVVDYVGA